MDKIRRLSLAITGNRKSQTTELDGSCPIKTEEWNDPPRDCKPLARWWWPGGSVSKVTCEKQLELLQQSGFGSVEVQAFLLGLDGRDIKTDSALKTVGEPSFIENCKHCAVKCEKLGMAFDITLGSGWPGGLPQDKTNAEQQLVMRTVEKDLKGGRHVELDLPAPPKPSYRTLVQQVLDALGEPDTEADLVAVLAGHVGKDDEDGEKDGCPTLKDVIDITHTAERTGGKHGYGKVSWDVPEGKWRVIVLYRNCTMHFIMGGAFPGPKTDALVVDHMTEAGANALLDVFAKANVDACPGLIRGVFVDSFEMIAELPFTGIFIDSFKQRLGYDLTPELPFLFRTGGESKYSEMVDFFGMFGDPLYTPTDSMRKVRVREDYEEHRTWLFENKFIERFCEWSRENNVEFRLQAHGGFGNYIDTFAKATIPEAEGLFAEGSFDFLKLASSAQAIMGRKFSSCESFITVRFRGTRLSIPEKRLLAGRMYSAGINRLTFHGISYPYTCSDGRAWYPFSGAATSKMAGKMVGTISSTVSKLTTSDDERILAGPLPMSTNFNSEYLKKPGVQPFIKFLGRMSTAMSTGEPQADVAWLMPESIIHDAADVVLPGHKVPPYKSESLVTKAFRRRALTYHRVSPTMLSNATARGKQVKIGCRTFTALLLPELPTAEPALVAKLLELARAGVPVLTLGGLPTRAIGYKDHTSRDLEVKASVAKLADLVKPMIKGATDRKVGCLCLGAAKSDAAVDDIAILLQQHVTNALIEPAGGADFAANVERRVTERGDILLVFNESYKARTVSFKFVKAGGKLTKMDPYTGLTEVVAESVAPGQTMRLDLSAVETLLFTLELGGATRGGGGEKPKRRSSVSGGTWSLSSGETSSVAPEKHAEKSSIAPADA